MAMLNLKPPLPVEIIGKGRGFAFVLIDYGQEHHLMWVVALDDGGEIWCASNPEVRVQANWSLGRTRSPPRSPSGGEPGPATPPSPSA